LTETCADYNRGGTNPPCFNFQPYRYERYHEDGGAQFAVVRKIKAPFWLSVIAPAAPATNPAIFGSSFVEPHQEYLPTGGFLHRADRGAATTLRWLGNAGQRASRAKAAKAMAGRAME